MPEERLRSKGSIMKHYVKVLSKDIVVWLCIGSMLLIVNRYFIRCCLRNRELVEAFGEIYQFDAESCLSIALEVVFPVFCVFLVLAYSIFQKQRKDGFFELNRMYAERKGYCCQMLLLLALDVGISVNALVWVLILYWKNCVIRWDYTIHILENIIVWYTLVLMVAILTGYTLALIQNKRIVFCLLVGILLLQSPLLGGTANVIPAFYAILAWLRLMPFPWSDAPTLIDYVGYPIVAESYWLPVFWMSICLFFHIYSLYPGGRKRRLCLGFNAGLFLTAVIILAYVPANLKTDVFNTYYQGGDHPQYYYRIAKHLPVTKEEAADFQISGYRMNFRVTDRLMGEVTIDIDEETQRDNYYFTLYHTYQVTRVWDQNGRTLHFQQYDDYLDIENPGSLEALTIQYQGSAPGCYSHEKGILLASYFPYYPRPGYHVVFDKNEYMPILEDSPCTYDITVNATQQIYSNLPEAERNHFRGEADGAFLLSGFVEEFHYRGIRVLYPYDGTEPNEDIWEESIDILLDFEEANGIAGQNSGVKTILLSNIYFGRVYTFGSNWAEMIYLSPDKMLQSEGYYRPDEREFILYYQFYLEHGYNEKNYVWLSIPSQ